MKRNILKVFSAALLLSSTLVLASCGGSSDNKTDNPTQKEDNNSITLEADKTSIYVGESATITAKNGSTTLSDCIFEISEGSDYVTLEGNVVTAIKENGKATIKAKKSGYKAGTIEITVLGPDAKLEFENATHSSPTGQWGNQYSGYYDTPVEKNESASNGSSVGFQSNGCTEKIEFKATKAGKGNFGFVMASTIADYSGYPTIKMSEVKLVESVTITFNGVALDLTDKVLKGTESDTNYYNWDEVVFDSLDVVEGTNTIIVSTIGTQGPNMDCVNVYGDLGITQLEPKVVTTEVLGTYTYFVNGYEWGPGVNRIVVDFGKNVAKSDLNAELFTVRSTGSQGDSRTVSKAYLVNDSLVEDDTLTSGSKVGLDLEFNVQYVSYWGFSYNTYGGCSPFVYDNTTQRNSWATDYGYEIRLATGKSLTIGDKTYVDGETPFVVKGEGTKVIEATKNWTEAKSFTSSDEKTLTYKAFETSELKADNVKNPLIIWLHGQGEGGTDPDIAILGNDVTNLGESKIQSYFAKEGGSAGSYVLAVQTPTMWMDNGEGANNGGESRSIYTKALKETIDKYIADNGDIDTSKIYLGGCSNGGYMTMNMAMEYGSFFKTYYPTCEAYKDSAISDEDLAKLKDLSIWFTASANDPTVAVDNFSSATYKRLKEAGAADVHYSLFEKVTGDDSGNEVEYSGHWSWIYVLKDQVSKDQKDASNIAAPSTEDVLVNEKASTLWGWLASK